MRFHRLAVFPSTLLIALCASSLRAQTTVTVRDKIVALPPISSCQDGATHVTVVTQHRLRPNSHNLAALVGKGIEVSGKPGAITCKFVTVSAAKTISDLTLKTSRPSLGNLQVDFYGTAPTGSLYMNFISLGVASTSVNIPSIVGPVHLDLTTMFRMPGVYAPAGSGKPFLKFVFGLRANILGKDFFAQAVSFTNRSAEMTNIEKFRW